MSVIHIRFLLWKVSTNPKYKNTSNCEERCKDTSADINHMHDSVITKVFFKLQGHPNILVNKE